MEVSPNDILANRSVGLKAAVCPKRSGWMSRGMVNLPSSAGMVVCLEDSYRGMSLEDDDEEDDEELLEDDDEELDDEEDELDELDEDDEDGGLYGSHAHTALLTLVHLCAK